MIKSHILVINDPIRIDASKGQYQTASKSNLPLKRGRYVGSKDKNSREWKGA